MDNWVIRSLTIRRIPTGTQSPAACSAKSHVPALRARFSWPFATGGRSARPAVRALAALLIETERYAVPLERWRGVDPQQHGLLLIGIAPAMSLRARKIEAVAGAKLIMFHLIQPHIAAAADDEDEFLALVMV